MTIYWGSGGVASHIIEPWH